jgi:hypothetical protein
VRRVDEFPMAHVLNVCMLLLLVAGAGVTAEKDSAHFFLASSFNLTSADFDRINGGQVVSRTLPVNDPREVETLGVVRMKVTPEFYVERLADIAQFKRDDAVLQIGVFHNPPTLQDVGALTLDDADIRSLRACRIGDCGLQLSADAISRFHQEVDWGRADAQQHANSLMRQILVDYVTEYQKAGATASMQYADEPTPLNLGREFVSLADSERGVWLQFPTLKRHLFEYPSAGPGTTDLVYWSKERVGRRTVASVTHLAISRLADDSPTDYAIASKHIYGSHYFDASLGLTVLLRDRSASSAATYVAYVNRSRVDAFDGMFGSLTRKFVTSRARSTVSENLAKLQLKLESEFATALAE